MSVRVFTIKIVQEIGGGWCPAIGELMARLNLADRQAGRAHSIESWTVVKPWDVDPRTGAPLVAAVDVAVTTKDDTVFDLIAADAGTVAKP